MTRMIAIIAIVIIASLPAPRCRVQRVSGRYWLVCPCRSVTYQCDDWYRVPRYRGGR